MNPETPTGLTADHVEGEILAPLIMPAEEDPMSVALSTNLLDPGTVPYFLWDEPMTVEALGERLRGASQPEAGRLLGKILREARDTDVWLFTTPAEVAMRWGELSPHLGRRRPFWEFLFTKWREEGLLGR